MSHVTFWTIKLKERELGREGVASLDISMQQWTKRVSARSEVDFCRASPRVEDASILQLLIGWQPAVDLSDLHVYDNVYQEFNEDAIEEEPFIYDARFSEPAKDILLSPVVEILFAYLTPSTLSSEIGRTYASSVKHFYSITAPAFSRLSLGCASGWISQDLASTKLNNQKARTYLTVIGWPSIAAHMQFRETIEFKKHVTPLRAADALEMYHIGQGQ